MECFQQVLRDSDKEPQLLPKETVQDYGTFSLCCNHNSLHV